MIEYNFRLIRLPDWAELESGHDPAALRISGAARSRENPGELLVVLGPRYKVLWSSDGALSGDLLEPFPGAAGK